MTLADRLYWRMAEDAAMAQCWRELEEVAGEHGNNPRFLGMLLRLAAEQARLEGVSTAALRARVEVAVWEDGERHRLSLFEGPRLWDGAYFSGGDLSVEDRRW